MPLSIAFDYDYDYDNVPSVYFTYSYIKAKCRKCNFLRFCFSLHFSVGLFYSFDLYIKFWRANKIALYICLSLVLDHHCNNATENQRAKNKSKIKIKKEIYKYIYENLRSSYTINNLKTAMTTCCLGIYKDV